MKSVADENSIGFLTHDVARLLGRRFNQRARHLGLTRAQCKAIAYIWRDEGIIQAALADLLDIEPISLVRLLDRMEEAGWVERRPDHSDRRARRLFLTDKAHGLMVQIREVSAQVSEDAFEGLGNDDRKVLTDLLKRVHASLQRLEALPIAKVLADPVSKAGPSEGTRIYAE